MLMLMSQQSMLASEMNAHPGAVAWGINVHLGQACHVAHESHPGNIRTPCHRHRHHPLPEGCSADAAAGLRGGVPVL